MDHRTEMAYRQAAAKGLQRLEERREAQRIKHITEAVVIFDIIIGLVGGLAFL